MQLALEDNLMRLARKWLARLFVALNLIIGCVIVAEDESSLLFRVIESSGATGTIALWALLLVALVGVSDVVINDFLPERFVLRWAQQYRHTIYMGMALGCLSMIFVVVKVHGPAAVLLHYGLVAFSASLIAVLDIRERIRESAE